MSLLDTLREIRFIIIPVGSRRERVYHVVRLALQVWKFHGFKALLKQLYRLMGSLFRNGNLTGTPPPITYPQWIALHEPNRHSLNQQRSAFKSFAFQPVISFVTPVYNPGTNVLRDTLESVLAQTYPNWEFCLANGSTSPEIAPILDEYAQKDSRFRVTHLEQNLGIAGNTNAALERARGEFIALLDHDDLVSPDMLYEVVKTLNQDPTADMVYFDEDKIMEDGRTRIDPWFKPTAWSPDLMLSTNYLMHSVIRKSLVEEVGGFNSDVDGAQDWDLCLRITEKTGKIVHIPRVFYHWRQVPGSASRDANAKPWAFAAQERCLTAYLARLGISEPRVEFPSLGLVRVQWPTGGAKASIIIPTKNNTQVLKACLDSILEHTRYSNYEIILVDNGSTEASTLAYYDSLAGNDRVQIVSHTQPFNFHTVNNRGAQHASGEVFIFLNNDTEILEPGWLDELVGWALRPEIGVVGTKLLRPDGTIQHAGIIMGMCGHGSHVFEGCSSSTYGYFGSSDWYRNYQAVTGACMAVRREVFAALNGFDETYIVGYGDIDLCLRAREQGFRVVYTPFAKMLHHEGATRGLNQPPSDVLRATVKMRALVEEGDSFFNPNLSYDHRIPSIANPRQEDRGKRLVRIMRLFDLIALEPTMNQDGDSLYPEPPPMRPPAELAARADQLLLVTHDLSRSGAPIVMWTLAAHLSQLGFKMKVLSPLDGPLAAEYHKLGVETVIEQQMLNDVRFILPHLEGADLVWANTILTWRAISAARAFNRAGIWWLHESTFGQKLLARYLMVPPTFAAANAVVFPCQTTADQYHSYNVKDNFQPIYWGLDLAEERIDDTGIHLKSGKLNLVSISSIEPRKGQDVLLQALSRLPEEAQQGIECYLIGRNLAPSFYGKIARKARRMSNVHLVGELPKEKVLGYLQLAHVSVIPSRDEALPLTLIEAMALGKCIISSDAGGIPEIINHGENGLLAKAGDPEELAERILQVYTDRQLLRSLSENALASFSANFSKQRFEEEFHTLVEKVLHQHYNREGERSELFSEQVLE
jgi:O-antigen biosynthesis protein